MKSDLVLHSWITAEASMVLPAAHQHCTKHTVNLRTGSWYSVHPDDRAVWDVRVYPMLDGLMLRYPLSSDCAFFPYLAKVVVIKLGQLSNS